MADEVVLTSTDGVLEIRLNRPEKKNALTRAMYETVSAALEQADTDSSIRVVLLTGTGDTFTSGNDIQDFQSRGASTAPRSGSRFLQVISSVEKPLIARSEERRVGKECQ
jgi:enoyl-CoA hydratase/carnithine racemase